MPSNEISIQSQAWDQLALKRYGSEKRMSVLLPVNVDEMDALLLAGGISLNIPKVEALRVKSLPPWERLK